MKEVAKFVVFLAVLLFLLGLSPAAFSQQTAQIVGTVLDAQGNPVEGAEVVVQDPKTGNTLARATTNAKGEYKIYGLAPGRYNLRLNPMATGVEGQTVAVTVGVEEGLTVSWLVSTAITAIAAATPDVVVGGPLRLGTTGDGSGVSQRAARGLGLGSVPGVSAGPAPPPPASPSA